MFALNEAGVKLFQAEVNVFALFVTSYKAHTDFMTLRLQRMHSQPLPPLSVEDNPGTVLCRFKEDTHFLSSQGQFPPLSGQSPTRSPA